MSIDPITIIAPTRGRPTQLRNMINSAVSLAAKPELVSVGLYVDNDDGVTQVEVEKMRGEGLPVVMHVGPRHFRTSMYDTVYQKHFRGDSRIVAYGSDDFYIDTQGWDDVVRKAFDEYEDKILLVGGDDGYNKDTITHGFTHSKVIEVLGMFGPTYFTADWFDRYLCDVFEELDRCKRIDIRTPHNHYAAGTGVIDKTMQEKNMRVNSGANFRLYNDGREDRIRDVALLYHAIKHYWQSQTSSSPAALSASP